jgi:polygalacturonase/uncharacterized protein YjdB
MALKSWAVAVGVGLLMLGGCSSDRPAATDGGTAADAPLPLDAAMSDATADALPDASVPNPVDPNLPPEPVIPAVCAGATLDAPHAVRATGDPRTDGLPIYDISAIDTDTLQTAIDACGASLAPGQKGSVHLRVNPAEPTKVAFVSGPLFFKAAHAGVTLWIDRGVTLFAAQDPRLFDVALGTPTCGTDANNNSGGCKSLINVNSASASTPLLNDVGVMGDGVIDGLGGEPMIGGFNGNPNGTWWDVAQHAKPTGVSHSNPRLLDVLRANRFTLYHVTLRNSPKFHVGLQSDNYIVWGVTVQTPSRAINSVGRKLTPAYARNTDGIDPSDSWNGVIAYSHISVGDDQVAFKCGHFHLNDGANVGLPSCRNLIVAHNQFGTGHGMSIGSETNGGAKDNQLPPQHGIGVQGVLDQSGQNVVTWGMHIYDLTIDGSVGTGGADDVDINGIRIKSDVSRGGLVRDVLYEDVCLRNLPNPLILNPHYDPTKTGGLDPTYQNIVLRNIHVVKSSGGSAPAATPVVTLLGLDASHRTAAMLDNVVVDGIDGTNGVRSQYADLALGAGPVNFTPTDNVSAPGSPSTVVVTGTPGQSPPPVACGDRFTVPFPDVGNDPSLDNNASLANLVVTADVGAAGLSPAFASGTTSYTTTIPFRSASVAITPTLSARRTTSLTVAQDGGAPVGVASGSPFVLTLPAAGATSVVTVSVTAEDATTTTSYTVRLTRVAAGTDATLSALTDSAGALAFNASSGQTHYTYSVPAARSTSYTVTPTASDPRASIQVNGVPVASGTPSGTISLASGAAEVLVAVIAEDGTTAVTYILDITVDQAVVPVTGITLSTTALRLDTAGSPTGALIATLAPPGATDQGVSWTSNTPSVATVDPAGRISAVSAGQAVITATSHDGGFTASCTVFVFSLLFSDDFEAGSGLWDLTPGAGGAFSIATDGTSVLKYAAGTAGGVIALVKDSAWSGVTTGDYYVEARIKPQSNSTTSVKQLYLIARYQDSNNWYAAGLNVQGSTTATKVEIAKKFGGAALTRPVQVNRPISLDTWYTVRFELIGSSLTVYLDGELIRTLTDTSLSSGKIGLYTDNKSFEIDDVKVGNPADRPVQLTISPSTDWAAEAGDAPHVVTVTAQRPDYANGGFLPDSFTVASSDPTVVSTAVNGSVVALSPLQAGTAVTTFSSASNPSLTRAITATVSPAFVQSTTIYDLTGRTTPAVAEPASYIDTRLSLTFDTAPALGTAGSIRILRKSDDALADVIKLSGETDAIGFPGQDQVRVVNVEGLVSVSGNTATIVPHHAKLAYGTEYYVAIANHVFTGATLGGTAFDGIGKVGNWSFTTRAAPAPGATSLIVDDDGVADFRTVQGALDHFMKNAARDTPVTVNVRNGTYQELLFLRAKNNVSIVGETRDGVVIQYRNFDTLNNGSGGSQAVGPGTPGGGRAVFLIETSDLLTLDTLTLKNTMRRSTTASSQAETLYFNNDAGRLIARNATFLSEQDTVQLKGYAWFWNTLVAGNVDFIWGNNRVAVFENSEIRSVGDTTSTTSGGYVVQARTVTAADKGFVFLNSQLTHGLGPAGGDVPTGASAATYLARGPGVLSSFDNVAFINCQMDTHVIPIGWAYNTNGQPPSNPLTPSAASGWREYHTTNLVGTPLDLTTRLGGYQLTDADFNAGFSSRAQIFATFGGGAGWNPQP